MTNNPKTNQSFILIAIVIVAISAIAYNYGKNSPSQTVQIDVVDKTLQCNQLYELKKVKYWDGEIGQSKTIFSRDLNTCLAFNLYNNPQTKEYTGMVMDMENDKALVYYNSVPQGTYLQGEKEISCEYTHDYLKYTRNGKTITDKGCEKSALFDKMFEEIRNYGFSVFDGISNQ